MGQDVEMVDQGRVNPSRKAAAGARSGLAVLISAGVGAAAPAPTPKGVSLVCVLLSDCSRWISL